MVGFKLFYYILLLNVHNSGYHKTSATVVSVTGLLMPGIGTFPEIVIGELPCRSGLMKIYLRCANGVASVESGAKCFDQVVCVSSVKELEELSGVTGITDLHRESIDHITIPSQKGNGQLKRVDEVFDCWFESGR